MWLHIPGAEAAPSTSSPYAPAAEDSISASSWQFQLLERSAWSRGKPTRSRNWYQRWKRALWLRRLCGAMPEPSTAAHGAASWICSLAASRASRTASPDASAALTTSATCGPTPGASSCGRGRGPCSSRTSPACSRRGLTKSLERSGFGETFASWASRLRQDCSRRRKSARATSASGCLSLAWPTALVADAGEKVTLASHQSGLLGAASRWPTPTARDHKSCEASEQTHVRNARPLSEAVGLWYTPNVPNGGRTLSDGTSQTGMTADGIKRQVGLENQARGWPNQSFGAGGMPLPAQAQQWPTPRSHEVGQYQYSRGDKTKPVATLTGRAYSLPVPVIYPVGGIPSKERRSLNPLFVEWLMGWPPGWTLLAWTDLGCSATALCLWRRRMRCALSRLGLPHEAPPAQLGLFG